jgi:hypothetical protein
MKAEPVIKTDLRRLKGKLRRPCDAMLKDRPLVHTTFTRCLVDTRTPDTGGREERHRTPAPAWEVIGDHALRPRLRPGQHVRRNRVRLADCQSSSAVLRPWRASKLAWTGHEPASEAISGERRNVAHRASQASTTVGENRVNPI